MLVQSHHTHGSCTPSASPPDSPPCEPGKLMRWWQALTGKLPLLLGPSAGGAVVGLLGLQADNHNLSVAKVAAATVVTVAVANGLARAVESICKYRAANLTARRDA